MAITGGEVLVNCLEAQGVDRVFCVPGESYLAVLDALHGRSIDVINARHEGGAAMMAEADGKMTGRPGICMVTRGPGATNAAAGVHIAKQDSTPMILFVGQIARDMRGREAFQEVDYRQTFGDLAKWVEEIDRADRIPEILSHAWHIAMSGRPGPVVLALPEDMLRDVVSVDAGPKVHVASPAPNRHEVAHFEELLTQAERPFVILGGSRWNAEDVGTVQKFAERHGLPVGCSFRRQSLFDNQHPNYAGDVGLGINPALKERVANSDLVILLGARFSENPSQSFTLLDFPKPKQKLIHIHSGAEELGRIYAPDLAINATPASFLDATSDIKQRSPSTAASDAHAAYHQWTDKTPEPTNTDFADAGKIMEQLRELLPDDTIMANGAGNYAIWLHRFWRYRQYGTQLSPTSGSMGYGLPAAIAGKLRNPEKPVICFAGDGCFQMAGLEFATATQTGAAIIVLVFDNGLYGTIRMHQERDYPNRVSATTLTNPDFALLAKACGGHGELVQKTDEFTAAFQRATDSGLPAIIHIKTNPDVITPATTLTKLRDAAK
ncbi:MAG: thiamine pyrophosphate-binding protein [Hyphomicrobiales bacterium]